MTLRLVGAALSPTLKSAAVSAVALAVVAVAVLGLGDGRCFTAPPESVAEQFVRKLGTHRWAPAREHFTPELAATVAEGALRDATHAFEQRWGRIRQVEGQPGPQSGDQAWAAARVTTARHAQVRVMLPLERRSGVWRVTGLPPIIQLH